MPIFRYRALNGDRPDGPLASGYVLARNRPEAKSKLRSYGFLVLSLRSVPSWEDLFATADALRRFVLRTESDKLYQPAPPENPPPKKRAPVVVAPSPASILIQHCDPDVRAMYRRIFETSGYSNLRMVDDHIHTVALAAVCEFDLIVLDIVSPGNPSGAEATREIRDLAANCSTPILGISTLGERAESLFMDAGADAFLTAPFKFEKLEHLLSELLPGRQPVFGTQ